ncbi:hypothetical protein [Mycobacterium liflandii]|uniref:hypothetical protein n=1 Tax=Mycobacterium liflandii TaxID=261524 RepID=UPI001EE6FF8A|nr:hypothetical protein [Mycobacterium liflandii]
MPIMVAMLAVLPAPIDLTETALPSPKTVARVAMLAPPGPASAWTLVLPSPKAVAKVAILPPMPGVLAETLLKSP